MFEEPKEKSSHLREDLTYKDQRAPSSRSSISNFMERIHSLNGLYVASSLLQLFFGACVVALSLLQSIKPMWLATVMTILGSLSIISGLTVFFNAYPKKGGYHALLHKSIKRVIENQN